MKKLLTACLSAAICFGCAAQRDSNSSQSREDIESKTIEQKNQTVVRNDKTNLAWELTETDTADIVSISDTSGLFKALFLIRCAKTENTVSGFEYIVRDVDQFPEFNFDYFEGPDAPAQKIKTVTMEVSRRSWSRTADLTWRFMVSGVYGCNAEAKAFCFIENLENEPNPLPQVAQYISEGGYKLKIIVSDSPDETGKEAKIEIKNEFPPIDPTSKIAKVLKGCRY